MEAAPDVCVAVFDALGREVADRRFTAGNHHLRFNGAPLVSGTYWVRATVQAGSQASGVVTRSITLLP